MGNRASRKQVDIHNIPINRVPHIRGERALEIAHEAVHLDERRSRPWVQHIRIRGPLRCSGGRSKVQVFREVPSTVSEVKIFDFREKDRSLVH